jgi:hypothetical protein
MEDETKPKLQIAARAIAETPFDMGTPGKASNVTAAALRPLLR